MRDSFPEFYYNPSIKELWKNAIFVPDANVLLDIYCYPPETSRALLKILEHLKDQDRLWIPHQFAQEYLKNLPYIRQNIREEFKRNKKALDTLSTGMLNLLTNFDEVTDFDLDKPIGEIKNIFQLIKKGLQEYRKKHEERLENDNLEDVVEKLLEGIIGRQFPSERLIEAYDDGARRFRLRQPPGFKDTGKDESRRYGDLIGWLQIINHMQGLEEKIPVIMITNDSSGNDWFYKPALDGKIRGPRPELVKEMRDKAEVDFYIHQTGEFIELADKYLTLGERIPETTIKVGKRPRRNSALNDPLKVRFDAGMIPPQFDRYDQVQNALIQQPEIDFNKQMQQTLENLQPQIDINEQIQKAIGNLQPQIDINEQIQKALGNLQPQIDINEQIQKALGNLQPQIDINEQIQKALGNLQPQIDINEQIQKALGNLQPQIDINEQIQKALGNLQPQVDLGALTRRATISLADIARNAKEAGLSSTNTVNTADRSREILSRKEDESDESSAD